GTGVAIGAGGAAMAGGTPDTTGAASVVPSTTTVETIGAAKLVPGTRIVAPAGAWATSWLVGSARTSFGAAGGGASVGPFGFAPVGTSVATTTLRSMRSVVIAGA